ncbi:MAG TPA: Phenylacetic acid catabolic protein, partial [Gaiellaceae bacterium]|nr:Phenylacetic acid catabolic protein [Gaiellaceae bacterium]
LEESSSSEVAGLAAKIEREEAYHRMHADMWAERLRGSAERKRFEGAVEELWPYSLGILPDSQREEFRATVGETLELPFPDAEPFERGVHTDDFFPLWEEMTSVRRSVAGASW